MSSKKTSSSSIAMSSKKRSSVSLSRRFLKRKGTVWTKASELNILCDAPVMVLLKNEDGTFDTWPPLDSTDFNLARSMYYREINGKKFQTTKAKAVNLKKKVKKIVPKRQNSHLEELPSSSMAVPPPATGSSMAVPSPPATANKDPDDTSPDFDWGAALTNYAEIIETQPMIHDECPAANFQAPTVTWSEPAANFQDPTVTCSEPAANFQAPTVTPQQAADLAPLPQILKMTWSELAANFQAPTVAPPAALNQYQQAANFQAPTLAAAAALNQNQSLPQFPTIRPLKMVQPNHQSYSYGIPMPRWSNSDYGMCY